MQITQLNTNLLNNLIINILLLHINILIISEAYKQFKMEITISKNIK